MYLSKLVLDPGHPQARRDLANPYEMHRTLSRAFAPAADTRPGRFLWRLESAAAGGAGDEAVVLVQSAGQANWEAVAQQPGYTQALYPNKYIELAQLLQDARVYVFRLACNPTVTRARKRCGLVREADQMKWLERQAEAHGFKVLRSGIGRSERMTIQQGRGGTRMTLQAVQFDGMLRAADVAKLGDALHNGIGHAKSFGLGMLSIAPVPAAWA